MVDCIDLDPTPEGTLGQVIEFWHDDTDRNVVAEDLAQFLLDKVEADEWAAAIQEQMRTN